MSRSVRTRIGQVLGIASMVALTQLGAGLQTVSADATPPTNTVTKLAASIPVYLNQQNPKSGSQSNEVSTIADPQNRVLIQMTGVACNPLAPISSVNLPDVIEYDTDTYAQKATLCLPAAAEMKGLRHGWERHPPATASEAPMAAVSPVSHRIYFADTYAYIDDQNGAIAGGSQLIAIDESPFRVAGIWPLPADALPQIVGLTWYAPTNDVIVMTDYGTDTSNVGPPGVAVTQVSAADGTPRGPSWAAPKQDCPAPLVPHFASAAAYRGTGWLYVPCNRNPASVNTSNPLPAILSAPLQRPDCPDLCVVGTPVVTSPPYPSADFMFDPGSNRGFMPQTLVTTGQTTVEAFDGSRQSFLSLTNSDGNAFGLDSVGGRYYAVGPRGITVVDGRRTPLAAGQLFPGLGGFLPNQVLTVLPMDASHPYRRLIAPIETCSSTATGNCVAKQFSIFADTLPISEDPPATSVDKNTQSGPIPPGADLNRSYSGTARGYGFHMDFVGSANQVLYNAGFFTPDGIVPFGSGNRDLMGASVLKLSRTDGGGQGQASALADANGDTQLEFLRCSDLRSARSCSHPDVVCRVAGVSTDDCEAPDKPANRPNTEQAWPFQDATCSDPALQSGGGQPQTSGFFATTSYDQNGAPVQTQVPGSDKVAGAKVACAGDSINGAAQLGQQGLAEGPLNVRVTSAETHSTVTPPGKADEVVSDSYSEAAGIHLEIEGVASLEIGRLSSHGISRAGGRAGTASTILTREMSDVTITRAGEQPQRLCGDAQSCSDNLKQVLANINASFGGHMVLFTPTPDDQFGGPKSKTGNGSPGGYTAVVQANVPEQYGDHQFNGMTPEEATFLPALRAVVFDDSAQLSRVVTDLAGVESDAEYGIQALGGDQFNSTFTADQTECPAGVTPDTGHGSTGFLQSCASDLQITAADSSDFSPRDASSGGATGGGGGGLQQLIVRVFRGFDWLRRNPVAALQMFSFLALLGLPIILIARRRMLEQPL